MVRGEMRWAPAPSGAYAPAVARFFAGLAACDTAIAEPVFTANPAVLFQGPIADALTHVGQLALLRGLAAAPVRPESYAKADIAVGRLGRDQADARAEFDGDASRPAR